MFLVGGIQQAIANMLRTVEPRFLTSAEDIWRAFAVIVLIASAVKAWAVDRSIEAQVYRIGETMLRILIVFTMIRCYIVPIPGIGYSFPQLITAPCFYWMNVLDVNAVENMYAHVSNMWSRVMMPSPWAFVPLVLYLLFMVQMLVTKMLVLYVIGWPLIAAALSQLFGPLFIPFILWPQMSWMFKGWLRSFIAYSFVPVVSMGYLMLMDGYVASFLTTMPPVITVANFGVYLYNAAAVFLFLSVGLWKIPGLTASWFSGFMQAAGDGGMLAAAVRAK